jgi:hypothetical protein
MVLMKLPWSREDKEGEEDQKSTMLRFSPSLELELVQRWRRRLLASDDAAAERQPHSSNSSAFRQPDGTFYW